jgi:predicted nuclease of predicted toxin-antitoxin system
MRLVVDECIAPSIVRWLRGENHDVISIFETARGSIDVDILEWSVREQRVLVTADKDFGDLVYRDGLPHQGIILLRLDNKTSANTIRVLSALFAQYADQIERHFVVVTETSVRVSGHRPSGS